MEGLYIRTLGSLYYFLNYSIFFFNLLSVFGGCMLYSYEILNVEKNNTLMVNNCDNLNFYNFLGYSNSFLSLLILSALTEIKIVSFTSNTILGTLNFINIFNISQKCYSFYSNEGINFWRYNFYITFTQSLTILFYLLQLSIFIRSCFYKPTPYKKLKNNFRFENDNNINRDRNGLYDNIIDTSELNYDNNISTNNLS